MGSFHFFLNSKGHRLPAGCCDFLSSFLWEVRPSADRCEVLNCCMWVLLGVSGFGVTTAYRRSSSYSSCAYIKITDGVTIMKLIVLKRIFTKNWFIRWLSVSETQNASSSFFFAYFLKTYLWQGSWMKNSYCWCGVVGLQDATIVFPLSLHVMFYFFLLPKKVFLRNNTSYWSMVEDCKTAKTNGKLDLDWLVDHLEVRRDRAVLIIIIVMFVFLWGHLDLI